MLLALTAQAQKKREFRGAWIQCVNGQFKGMPTQDMQKTLAYQLDELKKDGSEQDAEELKAAANQMLQENGLKPLPGAKIKAD